MNIIGESDALQRWLSSFECAVDKDIESFLHTKAVQFEQLSKARTYFVVDEIQMCTLIENDSKSIAEKLCGLTIYGYFSLALKVLSVPEQFSNTRRKKIDGLSPRMHGEVIRDFPCYLIGQLARNSIVDKESIKGEELLQLALSVIKESMLNVGGRAVMIECRNTMKLIKFYSSNGFYLVDNVQDDQEKLIQMLLIAHNDLNDL